LEGTQLYGHACPAYESDQRYDGLPLARSSISTQAGGRPSCARSRRAPRSAMTPLDAARLLPAVLGSPQANTGGGGRALQPDVPTRLRSSEKLFGRRSSPISPPPRPASFVRCARGADRIGPRGSLAGHDGRFEDSWRPSIEVVRVHAGTGGRIRISGLPDGFTASIEYVPCRRHQSKRRPGRAVNPMKCRRSLKQSRRITDNRFVRRKTIGKEDHMSETSENGISPKTCLRGADEIATSLWKPNLRRRLPLTATTNLPPF